MQLSIPVTEPDKKYFDQAARKLWVVTRHSRRRHAVRKVFDYEFGNTRAYGLTWCGVGTLLMLPWKKPSTMKRCKHCLRITKAENPG